MKTALKSASFKGFETVLSQAKLTLKMIWVVLAFNLIVWVFVLASLFN
jgi:hypothetical protein